MADLNDLELAAKAFHLLTLDEKRLALEAFARLKYRSPIDRFFGAVHEVIHESRTAGDTSSPQEHETR